MGERRTGRSKSPAARPLTTSRPTNFAEGPLPIVTAGSHLALTLLLVLLVIGVTGMNTFAADRLNALLGTRKEQVPAVAARVGLVTASGAVAIATKLLAGRHFIQEWLSKIGVKVTRIRRAMKEIERKTFHTCGLGYPLLFSLIVEFGQTLELGNEAERTWLFICVSWVGTAAIWIGDILRLSSPWIAAHLPLKSLLRQHEQTQLTGLCYFSLGCSLTITLFDRRVASAAILMLVLGDMSAALVGVAFGGDTVVVKLGRQGKKSVEGSVAMFVVCFVVGHVVFLGDTSFMLPEYAVFVGAFVATIVEVYTDDWLGLDDNVTIPLFAATAMHAAFDRARATCA